MSNTFNLVLSEKDATLFLAELQGKKGKIASFYIKKEDLYKNASILYKKEKNSQKRKQENLIDRIIDPISENINPDLKVRVYATKNPFLYKIAISYKGNTFYSNVSEPDFRRIVESGIMEDYKTSAFGQFRLLPQPKQSWSFA